MKASILILLFVAASSSTFATDLYWISTTPSNWYNGANWSTSSGGPNCGCFPDPTDVAIFNNAANGDCILDGSPYLGAIRITGYTGNIDLNGFSIVVSSGTADNLLSSGSISGPIGARGALEISSTYNVTFTGTDLGPGVDLKVTLTPTGIFTGGAGSVFGTVGGTETVTVDANSILLNGSIYNLSSTFKKTGNIDDFSSGGNTFNGLTTITNISKNNFRLAATTGDIFNNTVTFVLDASTPSSKIEVAYGTGTTSNFNGNVNVKSVDNGVGIVVGGIYFGFNGGASVLASGFTIAESGGFDKGTLYLKNITQLGSSPQDLDLIPAIASSTSLQLKVYNSIFNGNVTYTATNPDIFNNTFNGSTTLTKAAGANNGIFDSNTFNGTVNFVHMQGGFALQIAAASHPNHFNGNVTFTYGSMTANFNVAASTIGGDLSVQRLGSITGNVNVNFTGLVTFDGSGNQTIYPIAQRICSPGCIDYRQSFNFTNVTINKPAGALYLQTTLVNSPVSPATNIDISGTGTFIKGVVNSNSNAYLNFKDNAIAAGANDNSYNYGQVNKVGNDQFTFPVGDAGFYRPITISAPPTITSAFSAFYSKANHGLGTNADPALVKISTCEYWNLNRVTGTDNLNVTLSWNQAVFCNANYVSTPANLRVAKWNGTQWTDLGNGGTTGGVSSGTVITSSPATAFGTFTLGSITTDNVLPIKLKSFTAEPINNTVKLTWQTASELNNDYFTIERSDDGIEDFKALSKIPGAGTSNHVNLYSWIDTAPISGRSYYRLRQTDFDGTETYSGIVAIVFEASDLENGLPYPIPTKDMIYLDRLNASDDALLQVSDASGKILYRGIFMPELNLESFPAGVYTLFINSNFQIKQYRVIKY